MTSYRMSVLTALLAASTLAGCTAQAPSTPPTESASPAHDSTMALHHLHGLMAHGFEMALEGANLKMTGQMKMAGAVDAAALTHGEAMLSEGRALIDRALGGPGMTALHTGGGNDPAMTYTHDLGKAMTAVLDQVQAMPAVNPQDAKDMEFHHMHMSLAHAAVMASQAAALKMTAQMKMAGAVDDDAAAHADAMAAHARALYDETMKGDAMTAAHKENAASDGMKGTHALGDNINAVMDLLAKMP